MSTLLIDNYDSYTYNVFHLLAAVSGEEPIVVHNDMITWRALSRYRFDAIVLSPGPGRPERWHDFGVCADILRSSDTPVLGICLGHQGLGMALQGLVASAPHAMHGRLSSVRHVASGLFHGIPQDFSVVRYHSLAVTGPLGSEGRVTAWTQEGVVMGIEHRQRPMWGVQFHPESIATEHGAKLVENFYALARRYRPARAGRAVGHAAGEHPVVEPVGRGATGEVSDGAQASDAGEGRAAMSNAGTGAPEAGRAMTGRATASRAATKLLMRTIAGEPPTEQLFERLFGACEHAFWLDSADAPTELARRSYMGTSAGAGARVIDYDVDAGLVTVRAADESWQERASVFDVLERELAERRLTPIAEANGLLGGFVGYLGYECKADCGSPNAHSSDVPDAVLMLANRMVAVDHVGKSTRLLALYGEPAPYGEFAGADMTGARTTATDRARVDQLDGTAAAERWLDQAEEAVREVLASTQERGQAPVGSDTPEGGDAPPADAGTSPERPVDRGWTPLSPADPDMPGEPLVFQCGRGREQYLQDIARCQAALAAGESYEVCLTDQISTGAQPPPFELYRTLRALNPAPFSAYLKLGEVAVLSSSPERFLSVDSERRVQARPIKGTVSRSQDPAIDERRREELREDEKTYAEHLMIVDLLRNDLGRVCDVDSVRVPQLMVVEPYATVHQLVSTVSGVLEQRRSPVECVRACFPGGSMTGAPKLRTMEIIDGIEREARGVYSGALGYFGLDGSVDLSVVIRTIVMRPGATTIGAGGAIVMQSDAQEEFDEILLKARAPMSAIAAASAGGACTAGSAPGAARHDDAFRVELEPRRERERAPSIADAA